MPPFTYNNQCGSEVLKSYIPVFLLGYSIQLVLPLIFVAALTSLSHDSISPSIRMLFHGIIWPEYWLQASVDVSAHDITKVLVGGDSGVMLDMRTIFCNDVCNNWFVMVTFGLCSPVLAVAVVCSVLLKMLLWVMLVGRFTRCMLHNEDGSGGDTSDTITDSDSNTVTDANASAPSADITSAATTSRTTVTAPSQQSGTFCQDVVLIALTALAEEYIPLIEVLATSFWRLVFCSAIFVALLSWDMAMDEVGWQQSVWVPLVPLCYGVVLRCAAHLFLCVSSARDSTQGSAEKAAASHVGDADVSQSPLHVDKL